jgi:hypothetical protein
LTTPRIFSRFKREKGVDLFGEERGSAALADIKETDYYKGDDKSFYILLEGGDRRVFYVSTQEEATKWLHCIQTAIRSRYLYRRETLSGLSFIHTVEGEGDGITRPRILFLTRSRNISEDGKEARGKEVVLCRHVEYEKRLPLPPLQGDDELTLTRALKLLKTETATLRGKLMTFLRSAMMAGRARYHRALLARMSLDAPKRLGERIEQWLLIYALEKTQAGGVK